MLLIRKSFVFLFSFVCVSFFLLSGRTKQKDDASVFLRIPFDNISGHEEPIGEVFSSPSFTPSSQDLKEQESERISLSPIPPQRGGRGGPEEQSPPASVSPPPSSHHYSPLSAPSELPSLVPLNSPSPSTSSISSPIPSPASQPNSLNSKDYNTYYPKILPMQPTLMHRVFDSEEESCSFDRAVQWVGQYPFEKLNPKLPPTPEVEMMDQLHVLVESYPDHYSQTNRHKLNIVKDTGKPYTQLERLQFIATIIDAVVDYLNDFNITYWLDAGTLLGSHRHKDIIPWDTDGDIALTCDGVYKLSRLLLTHPLPSEYIAVFRVGPHEDVIPIKIADKRNGFYIDIIKWFPKERGFALFWPAWCAKCRGRPPVAYVDSETIFPLVACPLGNRTYLCPQMSQKYLSYWYTSISVPRKYKNYDVKTAQGW